MLKRNSKGAWGRVTPPPFFEGYVMKKLTDEEKKIRDIARADWNEQCNNFMIGYAPFRDKTAKACYERILKSMKGNI